MTIEEFQREASRAFESDAGVEVTTQIELSRTMPKPRFRVVWANGGQAIFGSGPSPRDAINDCKRRIAQDAADKHEALLAYAKANGITIP